MHNIKIIFTEPGAFQQHLFWISYYFPKMQILEKNFPKRLHFLRLFGLFVDTSLKTYSCVCWAFLPPTLMTFTFQLKFYTEFYSSNPLCSIIIHYVPERKSYDLNLNPHDSNLNIKNNL